MQTNHHSMNLSILCKLSLNKICYHFCWCNCFMKFGSRKGVKWEWTKWDWTKWHWTKWHWTKWVWTKWEWTKWDCMKWVWTKLDWTKWVCTIWLLDEVGVRRSGYWTMWVLDEVGMDELGVDELALGRSGCGRRGNRPNQIKLETGFITEKPYIVLYSILSRCDWQRISCGKPGY